MGRGSRGESRNTRWSLVVKNCHSENCAGDFSANYNLDQVELEFWKDFWTRDSHHQAPTFALSKLLKVNFQASYIHFFYVGVARERAQIF